MKTTDIEMALVYHLDYRRNLIIPNVFWGLNFNYELDLLLVKSSKYAWEIEIKTSLADLKQDQKKSKYAHNDNRIKQLYFAVPESLSEKALELIPDKAGLFSVKESGMVRLIKPPKINKFAKKLTDKEIEKLHCLLSMRIWTLKQKLYNHNRKIK